MSGGDTCFSHYEHLGQSHHQFHNMFCTIGRSQEVLSFFIPNIKKKSSFIRGPLNALIQLPSSSGIFEHCIMS